MFFYLLLAFTLIPVVELFFLFEVSDAIGGWNTIGLIFLTGVVGAALAKSQGVSILNKIQHKLSAGQLPTNDLLAGLLVFGGGLLLLTPGFFTDFLGFSMVFPLTRIFFVELLKSKFTSGINSGNIRFGFSNFGGQGPGQSQTSEEQSRPNVQQEVDSNPFENQNRTVFDDQESPFVDEQQVIDVNHRDAENKKD